MFTIRGFGTLCAISLALPVILFAQTKRTPTLEESISLKVRRSQKISPNGRYIAYQIRE